MKTGFSLSLLGVLVSLHQCITTFDTANGEKAKVSFTHTVGVSKSNIGKVLDLDPG